jgi:hypothetical protein
VLLLIDEGREREESVTEERVFGSYTSQNGTAVILTRSAISGPKLKREARSTMRNNKNIGEWAVHRALSRSMIG